MSCRKGLDVRPGDAVDPLKACDKEDAKLPVAAPTAGREFCEFTFVDFLAANSELETNLPSMSSILGVGVGVGGGVPGLPPVKQRADLHRRTAA